MATKDTLWKSAIEDFFPEMMEFFYPEHLGDLDLTQVEFLDKEFQQLFPGSGGKGGRTDKLVRVKRQSGKDLWLLIHVEVQGYVDKDFERRMFRYFYRIYDKHQIPIESLVIFTDGKADFRPQSFFMKGLRTVLKFDFHTYKVLEQEISVLESSDNPFSTLILICREFLSIQKPGDQELLQLKIQLFRKLLLKGYDKSKVHRLTIFIKHYVRFRTSSSNDKFDNQINHILKREKTMGLIEVGREELKKQYSRRWIQQGIEQGIEQGVRLVIERLLLKGMSKEEIIELLEEPATVVVEIEARLIKEGKLRKSK